MMISAIYPKYFGKAVHQIILWLTRDGADEAVLQLFAKEFAEGLPSPEESLLLARHDSEMVKFDDHDPGWGTIVDDLPAKMSKEDRRVALKRKKLLAEAARGPIPVESDDEACDPGEESTEEEPERHARSQEYGQTLTFSISCSI